MNGATTYRVTTFNLRNSRARDGANAWEHRRELVVDTIRAANVDLLGVQESLPDQQAFLQDQLGDYEHLGVGRDDGAGSGEAATVIFKRDRFEAIESGTFWLSPKPDSVGSKGWDAELPRICTWAHLRDLATESEILLFNTHFDHRGAAARVESSKLVCRAVTARIPQLPAIVMGDFNDNAASPAYAEFVGSGLKDAWRAVHPLGTVDDGTYHAFTGTRHRERIDWIFCTREFNVLSCSVDDTSRAGCWPSDHFPVVAELRLD
jgi:endonuclease/exonuclease/phosphatase family metal-dependent hydrolase